MKKFFSQLVLFALILMTASTAFAKESPEEQRAKLDEMSGQVLQRIYKKYPSAERVINNVYAYCTISASSVKFGFWGDDRGRGVAINNQTGERIYVKMKEVSVGVSVGAKEYDLVFLKNPLSVRSIRNVSCFSGTLTAQFSLAKFTHPALLPLCL